MRYRPPTRQKKGIYLRFCHDEKYAHTFGKLAHARFPLRKRIIIQDAESKKRFLAVHAAYCVIKTFIKNERSHLITHGYNLAIVWATSATVEHSSSAPQWQSRNLSQP